MAANSSNSSVQVVLGLKTNKYKGETYHELVGTVAMGNGNQRVGVSIPCDANGNVQTYTAKDGTPLMYGRMFKFNKDQTKRKNSL